MGILPRHSTITPIIPRGTTLVISAVRGQMAIPASPLDSEDPLKGALRKEMVYYEDVKKAGKFDRNTNKHIYYKTIEAKKLVIICICYSW